MVSVKCPCAECVHHGVRNSCKAKKINLTWRSLATVNEGRQEVWVCNQYKVSEYYRELTERCRIYEHLPELYGPQESEEQA